MKIKVSFLVFFCIALTSCSKYYGHGDPYDDDEIVLTETNYVFEGDLYKLFLTGQIDSLTSRAKILQAIIDNNQGTDEIKADLAATTALNNETAALEADIPGLDDLVSRFGIRIPPRVGPRPGVIDGLVSYVVFYDLNEYSGVFFDTKGKKVGQTAKTAKAVKGSKDQLQGVKIDLSEVLLPGSYLLKSIRVDSDGTQASYTNGLTVNGK